MTQNEPPQDLTAEQSVLGGMLLSRDVIPEVLEVLTSTDFYRPAHQAVFECIVDLYGRDEPADAVTVAAELEHRGELVRIGGGPYLHTLIATVPTAVSAGYYAEIVSTKARLRRIIEAGTRMVQLGNNGGQGTDLVEIVTQAQLAVQDIAKDVTTGTTVRGGRRRTWRPVDLTDVLDGTYQPPKATVGRRDDGTGLFYSGRIHSVASESEGGKTWFALHAALTELDRGNSVMYQDFEDDEGGVVGRLLDLGAPRDAIRDRFAYIRPEDALTAFGNRADLAEALGDLQPTLVVLDGITEAMALHGLELKDNTEIATFGKMLPRWIADQGPAVVALDHVVKDRDGRGRYAIGGVHKLNGINGAAYLLDNRTAFGVGLTGRSTVLIAKDRPAQLRKHALAAQDGLHWFADLVLESITSGPDSFLNASLSVPERRVEVFRPTVLMREISRALANAQKPLSKMEIEDRVRGKAANKRAALAVLVDEAFVAVEQGAHGARLHTLVTPFEEGET